MTSFGSNPIVPNEVLSGGGADLAGCSVMMDPLVAGGSAISMLSNRSRRASSSTGLEDTMNSVCEWPHFTCTTHLVANATTFVYQNGEHKVKGLPFCTNQFRFQLIFHPRVTQLALLSSSPSYRNITINSVLRSTIYVPGPTKAFIRDSG